MRIVFFAFCLCFCLRPVFAAPEGTSWFEGLEASGFVFKGNSVFSDPTLLEVAAPWKGRKISPGMLEDLRQALTRYYTDRGHINSGALIAGVNPENGTVSVTLVEGKIVKTTVAGNKRLKERYILSRLNSAIGKKTPFNIHALNQRLQLIKRDPRIKGIHAAVSPGLIPGEAKVDVKVSEATPWKASMKFNNHGSPAVGSSKGEISLGHRNVTGWGDALGVSFKRTKGFNGYSVRYSVPLTRRETTLSLSYGKSAVVLVSTPFEELDIESRAEIMGAVLRRPLHRSMSRETAMGAGLKKINAKTYILGQPFSFVSHPGDSEFDVTVLSFFHEFVETSLTSVLLLKSDLRFGLDWLGSTVHDDSAVNYADSRYVSWLGKLQWTRNFRFLKSALFVKARAQLSNDSLMPVGKFSAGGAATVRGYREGLISGDNGTLVSAEWRIPLFELKIPGISQRKGDGRLELCPFFDYAKAWNCSRPDPAMKEILSVGAGLRWMISEKTGARIYWGKGLKKFEPTSEFNNLQDNGVHFEAVSRIF